MSSEKGLSRYAGFSILIVCALLLSAHLVYLYLADAQRFPISTVKIAASYKHVTRKQLETILENYLQVSFFLIPVRRLQTDLMSLEWSQDVVIERIWPDTLKITVVEKVPVVKWNDSLMTADGVLFNLGAQKSDINLPFLSGPEHQHTDVLQMYKKLSKILSMYGLHMTSLQLRDNHAWELSLENGVQLRLGKRDLEQRLQRFCKAYPSVFAEKAEQMSSVDLRYSRGMAVQWKQQTGR